MDSEFRQCQKFICEHAHLNATESAEYVSEFIESEPEFKYGLSSYGSKALLKFIESHYNMERIYGDGEWGIPLEVYQKYGFGVVEDEGVVHPRGCDLPRFKTAISNQFFFFEETHRIKTW